MSIWLKLMTGPLMCRKEFNKCERRNKSFVYCKTADKTVICNKSVESRLYLLTDFLVLWVSTTTTTSKSKKFRIAEYISSHKKYQKSESVSREPPHHTNTSEGKKSAPLLFFSRSNFRNFYDYIPLPPPPFHW